MLYGERTGSSSNDDDRRADVYGGVPNEPAEAQTHVERETRRSDGALPTRGRGVAAEELRRHNLSTVLERLHLHGPASRSELTQLTELNRSTIADLIGELGDLGLVDEGPGTATARPGRPSSLVRPRPGGAVVLAIELAVDAIALATVGLGGYVYNRVRVARPRDRHTPDEVLGDLTSLAGPLLAALPPGHHLAGVGAAVSGITRRADGFIHQSPNLGWHDVPLAELLTEQLGGLGPVLVANEADLGALAEHRRGGHGHDTDLIYVSGSTGIGCGVIVHGEPLLGASGYAGEAGHMRVVDDERAHRCRCGRRGCWETEAGEVALLRLIGLPVEIGHVDEIVARTSAGDDILLAGIAAMGRWLGIGIGNLVNLFNPDVVILGGLFERIFEPLEPVVAAGMAEAALDAPAADVRLARCSIGPDAPLLGAAELVFTRVMADPARLHDGAPADPEHRPPRDVPETGAPETSAPVGEPEPTAEGA